MVVSRDGEHCIMMAEHELFYNQWADASDADPFQIQQKQANELEQNDEIVELNKTLFPENKEGHLTYRSVEMLGGENHFQLLVGTQDGSLYHASLARDEGPWETEEGNEFTRVLQLPDKKAILGIQMCSLDGVNVVFVVTENNLYQFTGDETFREMLQRHSGDGLVEENKFYIDLTIEEIELSR